MDKPEMFILLAEDEPLLQHLVHKQLAVLGYPAVVLAGNGNVAVEKALQKRYHIVLMDVMMPELDGIAATEIIRKAEAKEGIHTPIIAMTGIGDKERCLRAGMDEFLQKPVMLGPLKQTLEKWVKEIPVDNAGGTIIREPGKPAITERTFIETDNNLAAIQHRIENLRERFGLER